MLCILLAPGVRGQTSPLLYAETITVTTGGPFEFTFRDDGTGATNYLAEFSAGVGDGATWAEDTGASITSLGDGTFRVYIADPVQPNGFYRIVALRASGPVVANFAATEFQVSEGGMVSALINFSEPYTGTLRYTISGTASDGDYLPLTGEVQVNNSMTALIPVTLTDNSDLNELRYLALRLERSPGFQVGTAAETRLMIEENDAEWRGALVLGAATLGFVLQIQETSGDRSASLRSDPAGIFPAAPVDSTILLTENSFESLTTSIPLPPESNSFNTPAALSLHLQASNAAEGQIVSATELGGAATLITRYQGKSYLDRTNHGSFKLFKPPIDPSSQPVELVQAQ